MVALGVVAVLAFVAVPTLRGSLRRSSVRVEAQRVRNAFQEIRNVARVQYRCAVVTTSGHTITATYFDDVTGGNDGVCNDNPTGLQRTYQFERNNDGIPVLAPFAGVHTPSGNPLVINEHGGTDETGPSRLWIDGVDVANSLSKYQVVIWPALGTVRLQ